MAGELNVAVQTLLVSPDALAGGFEGDVLLQEEDLPFVEALVDSYAASGLGRERLLLKLDGFRTALEQKDVEVARCLGSQIASAIRARPKPFQKLLPRVRFQFFGNAEMARAQVKGSFRAGHQFHLEPQIEFLSRYRILSELKRTKSSTVFWAIEIGSGRTVIIKFFYWLIGTGEPGLNKFKREVRVLQTISHPNIVKMREFGERNDGRHEGLDFIYSLGVPYIVFEWEGNSIENLAKGKNSILPLGWPSAKAITLQLASALSAMHEAGLLHRDVSANNILLKKRKGELWRAKLCDFGLACDKGHFDDDPVFGTLPYMSPEQLRGEPLSARTDIYGLGVLLFQLLTGKLPFDDAYDGDRVAQQHFYAPIPSLRSVRPDISSEMESIVVKAMAKNPRDRFQSAAEMAEAIRRCK